MQRRTSVGLLVILLGAAAACAQEQRVIEPGWLQQQPPAPDEAVRAAEELLRDNFREDRFESLFQLRVARTVTSLEGRSYPTGIHLVYFSFRIDGPDFVTQVPVWVALDRQGQVVKAHGLLPCREQPDACPPFKISRATAIETARSSGLERALRPTFCPHENLIEGFCVYLSFVPEYRRYVWQVDNRLPRGWRFWESDYWACKERGESATIDASTGKLYGITPWCLTRRETH